MTRHNWSRPAHLSLIDQLLADAQAARPTLPALSGNSVQYVEYHELQIGNDTLRGDDGDDTLLGGDASLIAPLVTGTPGDLPDSIIPDGLDSAGLAALESGLRTRADAQATELADRRTARTMQINEELARRTPLDRIAYVASLDRTLDKDDIQGGGGNDLAVGDDVVIATPLVLTAPTTEEELRDLDRHVELLLDQISNGDRAGAVTSFDTHVGRTRLAQSTTDALSPEARHGAISGSWDIDQDTIDGEEGDDILLGDHVAIVSPLMIDDSGRQVSLRRSAYGIGYLEDAMREFMDNPVLDGVNISLSGDKIDGGNGNDVMLGSVGDDELDGRAGDDVLRGGNGLDILDGGTGTNEIRDDGGNYPHLDLSEQLGGIRFATTTPMTTQLLLDAAAGAETPANWVTTTPSTTDPNANGNGDPDTPVPPVARTIDIVGNDVVVTGQSFVLNGSITDLPNGATPQLQWEVTDAGGNIVAVGSGATLEFMPSTAGTYVATLIGATATTGWALHRFLSSCKTRG